MFKILFTYREGAKMSKNVGEIMNTKLETIPAEATVYDAIEKLIDKRIRSLLVLPKDENDEYGVVTVRNIIFKVLANKIDPKNIKIGDIASKPVITVPKHASIDEVFDLMKKNNIARVFIKEDNKIIGVISFFDILGYVLIEKAKQ
jgi:isocitrate dehydrogenase